MTRGQALPRSEGRTEHLFDFLLIAALIYWILLGGSEAGSVIGWVRAANAAIAGGVVLMVVIRARQGSDTLDLVALLVLAGFLVASLTSLWPRRSLDAAMAALAWYACFWLARRIAMQPETRRLALTMLGVTGLVLALMFGLLWAAVWIQWFSTSDLSPIPPLNSDLPTLVYWHRYVVAAGVALLLPAQLVLWDIRPLRPAVIVGMLSAAFVIFASGYRALWLGIAIAVSFAIWRYWIAKGRPLPSVLIVGLLALGAAAGAASFVTNVWPTLVDRLLNVATLSSRFSKWSEVIEIWQGHVLTGVGPGSVIPSLASTDYFQAREGLVRHADSAPLQLLAAGGLVLAVPMLVLGIFLLRRHRPKTPTWGLWVGIIYFTISLTDNPSVFASLNAILFVAIASACPVLGAPRSTFALKNVVRSGSLAALGVLGVVFAILSSAAVAYDRGIGLALEGDLEGSTGSLRLATSLDPASPLYLRELGLVELALGDDRASLRDLQHAAELNSSDQLTLEALAVAQRSSDPASAAATAASGAVRFPRSGQMALLASVAGGRNDHESWSWAVHAVAVDPWIVASRGWLDDPSWPRPTADFWKQVAELAVADAQASPGQQIQAAFLVAMSGGEVAENDLVPVSVRRTLQAWNALLSCDLDAATTAIRAAGRSESDSLWFWMTRHAIESATGVPTTDTRRLASITHASFSSLFAEDSPPGFGPTYDRRLYGRQSLAGLDIGVALPGHREGVRGWMEDPVGTANRIAPDLPLSGCSAARPPN